MTHSQDGALVPQSQDGAREPPCTSLPALLFMHLQVNCSHIYTGSSDKNAPICNVRYFGWKTDITMLDMT